MENSENLLIFQFEKFQKFPEYYIFENHQISINDKFIKIDLYQKTNMRIDKIASSAGYQIDHKFQNLLIFGAEFRFFKLKKF